MRYKFYGDFPFSPNGLGNFSTYFKCDGFSYFRFDFLPEGRKVFALVTVSCAALADNPFVETVEFPECTYVFLRAKNAAPEVLPTLCREMTVTQNGEDITVSKYENNGFFAVKLQSKDAELIKNIPAVYDSADFECHTLGAETLFVIRARRETEGRVWVYRKTDDFHLLAEADCDGAECDGSSLTLSRTFRDARARRDRLVVTGGDDGISLRSEKQAYGNPAFFDEMTPLYFLESVKAGFYDEAKSYLSEELRTVSDDALAEYFAPYDRVFYEDGFFVTPPGKAVAAKRVNFEKDRLITNFSVEE